PEYMAPRTNQCRLQGIGTEDRRLLPGSHTLRGPNGPAAIRGRQHDGAVLPSAESAAAAARDGAARAGAGTGGALPEGTGEESGRPLPRHELIRRRAGRVSHCAHRAVPKLPTVRRSPEGSTVDSGQGAKVSAVRHQPGHADGNNGPIVSWSRPGFPG